MTHDGAIASCPRCGYDQRGVIASWRESCPLESVCAECGLSYSCAEVLMPGKFEPLWLVEFALGNRRAIARSCAGTLARSFLPWRFWSQVKMSHRIRPRRLGVYVAALLLPFLFVIVLAQAAAANYVYTQVQFQMRWRAWQVQTQAPTLDHSRTSAIIESLIMPFASASAGTFVYPDGTTAPYPAPDSIWGLTLTGGTTVPGVWPIAGTGGIVGLLHMAVLTPFTFDLSLPHLLAMMAAYALFPFTFALLPQSRRKAKVRWAHIARATIYGLFIPLSALFVAMICVTFIVGEFEWFGFMLAGAAATLALPIAAAAWWAFAIRHYMKMPHAFFMSASLMVLTLLSVCAIVWLATGLAMVPDSWLLLF